MSISKTKLFTLERAYDLLVRLVEKGACDLTEDEQDQLDFDCIKEELGAPKKLDT